MRDQVEIITDEAGNKQSVLLPYAMYEELVIALAAHDETMDKLMKMASAMVESQALRVEANTQSPTSTTMQARDSVHDLSLSPEPAQDPKQDIQSFQRARGYFTETGGFWMLAGSIARFNVSNAFEAVESLVTLRRKLVDEGVLASDPNYPDYIFTRDCYFNSASTAACIVDGNARNSPDVWRKK
jgi:Domain of unknown function (DUF4357)